MSFIREEWSNDKFNRINNQLISYFLTESSQLHKACQYPIETGGKRIRPLFLLAAVEGMNKPLNDDVFTCACALELVHTYSLVHDDLPCMDDDDVRRGKPTVHKVYGDNVAVLVGDSLLTKAFEILAGISPRYLPEILACISEAAGTIGMIGGQSLDIGLEGPVDDIEVLQRLHNRKTGALITCALHMAAILSDATDEETSQLIEFGRSIGLAFQLIDDILDADQDKKEGGPPSFVKLMGVEWTQERSQDELNNALHQIKGIPNPSALTGLANFTVQREY
jgi:geranylgeranyl diphosphate synthase, type II